MKTKYLGPLPKHQEPYLSFHPLLDIHLVFDIV